MVLSCSGRKALLTATFLMSMATRCWCCPGDGATAELWPFLYGRCLEYSTFVNPSAVCKNGTGPNCTRIADLFVTAIDSEGVCNVSMNRFDDFLNSTRQDVPPNKNMFWEGVYEFVLRYSERGKRANLISDTLTGYLLDGLKFCAGKQSQCPGFEDSGCQWNAEYSFWASASKNFASLASGVITIMLNASTGDASKNNTFFALWELPNLRPGFVTLANIWLVHNPGHPVIETCESSGILQLKSHLAAKNISWTCSTNPEDVLWLLCWDDRQAAECQGLLSISGSVALSLSSYFPSILITLFVCCTIDL